MKPFFYLPNLRTQDVARAASLTEFKFDTPEMDKDVRREWARQYDTEHCFYSMCEGIEPSRRCSTDNPAARMYGLVVDYDTPIPVDVKRTVLENRKLVEPPTFVHRTPSGNFRMIWVFDEPLPMDGAYARQFLEELSRHLKCAQLFPGCDVCSENPYQFYDIGTDWTVVSGTLDQSIPTAALVRAVSKKSVETDLAIPMDVIETECVRRYAPRISQLQTGQRVPLFWINDGIERTGGVVTDDGVVCFSDRAGAGFVGWRDILGMDFCREYETKKIGSAVDGVWYDGKRFFRFTRHGLFDFPKEDLTLELRANGLSNDRKKGQRISEVENAMLFIQQQNRVHGVAPILHEKNKVVTINGQVILNSSRCKPVEPAKTSTTDDFPFLHGFFHTFLDTPAGDRPLDYLFAWMKRAYEGLHYGQLLQGQALILVGPTGRGKSLFSNQILAGLLGGVATASDFLQARTQFNKELAENPVWAVDDTTSSTNAADHRKFTELLKARIANPHIEVQAKYFDSMRVPHSGRVVISLNEDVQSLSVVPALDVSNADKIIGFRINTTHVPSFPPNHELEETIRRELPFFARWLLDWEQPTDIGGSARYGVGAYLHPFIINAARDNGSRAPALEAIELFARVYRVASGRTEWRGTATELRSLFSEYSDLSGLAFGRDHYALSRGLASAEEAYLADHAHARPVTSESRGKGKRFTINLSPEYDDHDD